MAEQLVPEDPPAMYMHLLKMTVPRNDEIPWLFRDRRAADTLELLGLPLGTGISVLDLLGPAGHIGTITDMILNGAHGRQSRSADHDDLLRRATLFDQIVSDFHVACKKFDGSIHTDPEFVR
eukprot:12428293-Karenia_brevis.AAC.1